MSLYDIDTLISQARKLAAEYKSATEKTLPGVSNEIAEHDAAKLLDLQLCNDRSAGFDAIGCNQREGIRYQIKGRTIFDESKTNQRLGQIKSDKTWDAIVLVLLNSDYEAFELYEATREEVLQVIDKPSSAQKKRGALSVARFRAIGTLVWSLENNYESELWSNRDD